MIFIAACECFGLDVIRKLPDFDPKGVFILKDYCPAGGCGFGEWTVKDKAGVPVYRKPAGKKVVARLKHKERVKAIAGELHIPPVKAEVIHPSSPDLKKGAVLYLLYQDPSGDGDLQAWMDGNLVALWPGDPEFSYCAADAVDDACTAVIRGDAKAAERWENQHDYWWVQVRTSSGVLGWVQGGGDRFSGYDNLSYEPPDEPADEPPLEWISEDDVPLSGSQCEFSAGEGNVLRSDGIDQLWIKVGGKLVRFKLVGTPDAAMEFGSDEGGVGDRWHPTFVSEWGSVALDVKTTAVGEADTSEKKGTAVLKKGKQVWKLQITGGCAA
ncbi:MAG: hypothetical protein HY928_03110 [Elusimicrobia bacterium]|nr:hypothetical protein [Elusimicrobiota bacterium]